MNKPDAAKASIEAPELGEDPTSVSAMTSFYPNVDVRWNPSCSRGPHSIFSSMLSHESTLPTKWRGIPRRENHEKQRRESIKENGQNRSRLRVELSVLIWPYLSHIQLWLKLNSSAALRTYGSLLRALRNHLPSLFRIAKGRRHFCVMSRCLHH